MRFEQEVVLITGAGKGLGRAIALAFGAEGARLVINDLTPVNLDHTEDLVCEMGRECLAVVCDISKKRQVQGMFERVLEQFGRMDILINNAAVEPRGPLIELDEWNWDRTVDVNLKGPFLTMQSAARVMQEQGGGRIVNIGAREMGGEKGAHRPVYAATKQGLLALTREAAIEMAAYKINVNMIVPGPLGASMVEGESASDEPTRAQRSVAEALLNLCAEEVRLKTGEVMFMKDPQEAG